MQCNNIATNGISISTSLDLPTIILLCSIISVRTSKQASVLYDNEGYQYCQLACIYLIFILQNTIIYTNILSIHFQSSRKHLKFQYITVQSQISTTMDSTQAFLQTSICLYYCQTDQ